MAATRDLDPFEKFHTYWRGYADGVVCQAKRERFTKHEREEFRALYEEGYTAGTQARCTKQTELCERFGYKPNPFR